MSTIRRAALALPLVLVLAFCPLSLGSPAFAVEITGEADDEATDPTTGSLSGLLSGPLYCTRVYIDAERVVLPVPAIIAGSYTLVPARAVFENLGAAVSWDGHGGVTITAPAPTAVRTINLWVGQDDALVDGRLAPVSAPPALWRDTVMVPARFVAENMGLAVTWDNERRAVCLWTDGLTGPAAAGAGRPEIRDITLAFAGDTLLDMSIGRLCKTYGPDYVWEGVAPTLSAADLAMVNLECCVSTRGTPFDKQWTFRAAPETLAGVKNAGVDIVCIANNHIIDYGRDAFADTLDNLAAYGIPGVGAGRDAAEAAAPVILEAGDYDVGYLAGTYFYVQDWPATGTRSGLYSARDIDAFAANVKALKDSGKADFIAVNVHWGIEGDSYPNSFQKSLGHALIDAGADMVIGHHPHILQGIEVYKEKLIVYSLGNFIFTHTEVRATQESGILLVTLDEAGVAAARFMPVFTNYGQSVLETGADYDRLIEEMNTLSAEWGTTVDPAGWLMIP